MICAVMVVFFQKFHRKVLDFGIFRFSKKYSGSLAHTVSSEKQEREKLSYIWFSIKPVSVHDEGKTE